MPHMQPLAILGASGHAKMVIEAARSNGNYEPVICLGHPQEQDDKRILDVEVNIESDELLAKLQQSKVTAFVAIGENRLRRKLLAKLESMQFEIATIIDASAIVSSSATVGRGTVVMPGAMLGAKSVIGQGTIVNSLASVDHDCHVGNFVHIAPGVRLAGNVEIGDDCFLGINACVVPERKIGSGAIVGAGGVVIRDIPSNQTWVGCPAKQLR